jgi:hypothetical protein
MTPTYSNHLYQFSAKNGQVIVLSMTETSGNVVYRNKIDTIIGIMHPGVELGVDQFGRTWIAHHHFENDYPVLETIDLFSKGTKVFYDNRSVQYNRLEIVARAFEAWKSNREYHWLRQNCQHFVNDIVKGEHRSEAIDKVSDAAMISGGILALIGLLSGNKNLITTGITVAGAGAVGKGLSRI